MSKENDTILDYMNIMADHTVLKYEPQAVVVDIVRNFWLKHFSPNELRRLQAKEVENKTKKIYLKSYPRADEETLHNFANDVVFHLVYELTELAKRKTWSKF